MAPKGPTQYNMAVWDDSGLWTCTALIAVALLIAGSMPLDLTLAGATGKQSGNRLLQIRF